jgi:hypothetical protein
MAQRTTSLSPEHHELVLLISDGRPVRASELGELLTALARDYRQVSRGRLLVVTQLESGSLWILLKDAALAAKPYLTETAEYTKAAQALFEFARGLKRNLARKKSADGEAVDPAKSGPFRSIESIVKVAADTGAELSLKYAGSAGEVIEITLTPVEAIEIRERDKVAAYQARIEQEDRRLLPSHSRAEDRAKALADELELLAISDSSEPNPLIVAVVRLLRRSGNEPLIEMLAQELDGRGYPELAAAVRKQGSRDDDAESPPKL